MEYGLISSRGIGELVNQLNVVTAKGWELAAAPVYDPRNRIGGGVGTWFAIIRLDTKGKAEREQALAALRTYEEMCEDLKRDRAELAALRDLVAARFGQQ